MNESASGIVGLLILTPIAILIIVVFGAIKFSSYCPGRWKLLRLRRKRETGHKRKNSAWSSDNTGTDPSVDLEDGHRIEAK